MGPEVGATVIGRLIAEDVTVAFRAQDGHGAVVVPAVTAVLARGALRAPWSFQVRTPLQKEGQGHRK